MPHSTNSRCAGAYQVVAVFFLLTISLLISAAPLRGDQNYVTRYDLFAGYTVLNVPHLGLTANGFHLQAAVRPRTWFSLGVDYSISTGSMTLTPTLLTTTVQQQLTGLFTQLAQEGLLPAGYTLSLNNNARIQTITAGPQLAYRHFSKVTLFLRPSIGAIHASAVPQPADAIAKLVVTALAPTGSVTDTTAFYGFGGGVDFLFTKHFGVRVQTDLVYQHLFSNLIQNGSWTSRVSIGPCFNFGRNIARKQK